MTPETFIAEKLSALANPEILPEGNSMEDRIYTRLMSKKFRKYATNSEYQEHIRSAIALNVMKSEPIKLSFVFGGYKLWRLEESPEVDWAELFSLMYYAKWLVPICNTYGPGVSFDFFSDDVILELMDNVPRADTEAYLASFRCLLTFMIDYIPSNLKFTLNRVGDQYATYDEFLDELESLKHVLLSENGGYPAISDEMRGAVELNVRLTAKQEADPEWREKVFLIHEAYARVSKRRPYYRTPEKIMLITKQLKNTLAVGTTKTSVVKFWIGAGVLKDSGDGYTEYIYSPKQLAESSFERKAIQLPGLTSKNFGNIRVLR